MKMMMSGRHFIPIATGLMLAACGKDLEEAHEHVVGPDGANTVVAMSMAWTHNGSPFDTSITLTDAAGTLYKIDQLRFYMGGFRFLDDNGDTVASFPEKYLLVELEDGGTIRNIGQLSGHLHTMAFALGVDSVLNHTDPLLVDEPLGVNGVFWTWAQGYIFLAIDGRWDSNGDGVVGAFDQGLSYHCGMDELYTPVELVVHTDAHDGGNVVIPLELDVDTLMAGMNISSTPLSHEFSPITQALMTRLAAALTHQP